MSTDITNTTDTIRFAQFNASLNRRTEGQLVQDLTDPTATMPGTNQAKAIAEIVQRTSPDVVLINEFDYFAADPTEAVKLFQQNFLGVSQNGANPVEYPYFYIAPSNTGVASGLDLDNNGAVVTQVGAPGYGNDAFGFGNFPGQFGMLLLSKYPIDTENVRTFQNFRWQDMPDSLLPTIAAPNSDPWYSAEEQAVLRLSSKSHWDVPIQVNGKTIHALVSHPTPPVFDGPEDRNGKRNYDEIRFWSDYVTPGKGDYIYDDQGRTGALSAGSSFVIMGDQNADPFDGDSFDDAILQLLDNRYVNTSVTPSSEGGVEAAERQHNINDQHQGNPAFDTADFSDITPGNLRADYVLPSQNLKITDAQIFWPKQDDPLFRLIGEFDRNFPPEGFPSSDHKLVWVDVQPLTDASRKTVTDLEFLGAVTFPTGLSFQGTEVGGLSGLAYDAENGVYYAISDDRSERNPARYYTLSIDLSDGELNDGDVNFENVTTLLDESGQPFAALSLDPEGIALTEDGDLYISSEGDANRLIDPFVNQFSLAGEQLSELPVDDKFLPTADQSSGIRNNLAFESLTITPDNRYLYTATENALYQDGDAATLEDGSPTRIVRYNLQTGEVDKEILYITDPVAAESVPAGGFQTNGLVELLALDNNGNLLALERSFSAGVGNSVKLYEVRVQNTTDIKAVDALADLEVDAVAEKRLLLDFADLGIPLDNLEAIALGDKLPDGRQTLIVTSDNNFSPTQSTQVFAFALDTETLPAVAPVVETPAFIDNEDYFQEANQPLNILLVNDDGYEAQGIAVLYEALVEAGHNVTLVAPKVQQSGRGTAINTDKIFRPIELSNYEENKWFVDGTPVVTTLAGLDYVLQDNPPDLVISGINEGENIGDTAISSGTVSAAIAALQKGIPAIAVSAGINLSEAAEDYPSTELAYEIGAQYVVDLIGQLQSKQDRDKLLPDGTGLNINIPANAVVEGVSVTGFDEFTSLGFRFGELPASFGEGQSLLVVPGSLETGEVPKPDSEGQQFLANRITVTPLDGNWSAPEQVRQTLDERIDESAEVVSTEPLNILLVNDDGYEAEGIEVMYNALVAAGHNVTIVAPKVQQSGQGTSINADKIFRPIEVVNYEDDKWFVDGSPVVTTLAGLDSVLKDNPPDLVISGINEGENIGLSAISSGTLSAAVAALQKGTPSIAVSAGINLSEASEDFPSTRKAYEVGADYVVNLIAQLQATQGDETSILPTGIGLNVNIPAIDSIQGVAYTEFDQATSLGFRFGDLPPSLGEGQSLLIVPGTPSENPDPDSEGEQFLAGYITVTPFDGDWGTNDSNRAAIAQELNQTLLGDADDPAIWVNDANSDQSLVIAALKDGGLVTFNLDGSIQQNLTARPYGDIRYNNVDLTYGFELDGEAVDLAIATDRRNDTLAIWKIDPETRQLVSITAPNLSDLSASIFGIDDGEQTAYGIATYTSPIDGKSYVFVSQREGDQIAQLELIDNGEGQIDAKLVRTLTVPISEGGELEDAQVEGMVVDRELGYLYVGQEKVGIWKFQAEVNASVEGRLIEPVKPDGNVLTADVEGLTIYYAADGKGYLLASSQGDSSYAAFSREGNNDYLGSFVIDDGIDGVEESDGADVTSVALGSKFPNGLLVVHDGSDDPAVVGRDDEEVQNLSTNFKFVSWDSVAKSFQPALEVDTTSYDPRNPTPNSLLAVASGDTNQTSTVLWAQSTFAGPVRFEYSIYPEFDFIFGYDTRNVTDPAQPVKVSFGGLTPGQTYYYRAIDAAGDVATGKFTTPNAIDQQTGLTFGVTGDWQQAPPFPSLSNADEADLAFFLKLGDTIYADTETPALPGVTQARTLSDFRTKHAENVSERFGLNTLKDLYASTSIFATIDDHEVVDNFAGGARPGESPDAPDIGSSPDPLFTDDVRYVNDTRAYEEALQAFQEYHPIQDKFYGETGDDRTAGERQLYRYTTYGKDAAMIILDTRSFRDVQLAPVDPANPVPFLVQTFDPTRTLLGKAQLADLKNDLLTADQAGVTWKFVAVPEPIQNFGVLNAEDRFEGYAAERTELLKFIDDNNIDNVVFMSGDFHGTIVNNLTYQTAPGQPQVATNAFEIVTGPAAFFDGVFGRAVANISTQAGLITPEQRAFYDQLPIAPDADDLVNDQDDFIKQLLVGATAPLGYDPVGLNNNLPEADGLINATLLQGDYVSTHTYGWTEFDIDQATQKLTVTTYGINNYSEADLLNNPSAITGLSPRVVSQFEVTPVL
jgi:5'/3'-nucleotidase SurE